MQNPSTSSKLDTKVKKEDSCMMFFSWITIDSHDATHATISVDLTSVTPSSGSGYKCTFNHYADAGLSKRTLHETNTYFVVSAKPVVTP